MKQNSLETIWIYAFRYCLGRYTSAPYDFVRTASAHWDEIPPLARKTIQRELYEALARGDVKDKEIRADWEKLAKLAEPTP